MSLERTSECGVHECSMKEDEIANDGHLSFCRMILEQLKTSGGDPFVLQSVRFVCCVSVCVCALWRKQLPMISFVKLLEFPHSVFEIVLLYAACCSQWIRAGVGMFGCSSCCCFCCFFLSSVRNFFYFCILVVFYYEFNIESNWIESNRHISCTFFFAFPSLRCWGYSFRVYYAAVISCKKILFLARLSGKVKIYHAHEYTISTTTSSTIRRGNTRHCKANVILIALFDGSLKVCVCLCAVFP